MPRATIEWSYDGLSLKKQRVFERLLAFTRGGSVETAVAVLESFGAVRAFAERRRNVSCEGARAVLRPQTTTSSTGRRALAAARAGAFALR
ncbi:MAG: hypothetical protein WBW87_10520 [Candidatus Cybelea sp.]